MVHFETNFSNKVWFHFHDPRLYLPYQHISEICVAGFKEADLLRMGCSRPDVLSLAVPHGLSNLRAAAVSVSEILAPDACGGLLDAPRQPEQTLGGCRGAAALRSAGYTVEDVASAKLHTTWDLRTVSLISSGWDAMYAW